CDQDTKDDEHRPYPILKFGARRAPVELAEPMLADSPRMAADFVCTPLTIDIVYPPGNISPIGAVMRALPRKEDQGVGIRPNTTQLSQTTCAKSMTPSGHLERFPPERLSGRYRIDQQTSDGAYSGDGLAPLPALSDGIVAAER